MAESLPKTVPRVQVKVADVCRRGVSVGQLLDFFERYCGDIVFRNGECLSPVCMATKLIRLCLGWNRDHRTEMLAGTAHRLDSNLYAVNTLLILPLTKADGVSYAEYINPDGLTINVFVSHYWGEDFGEFCQSTYRYALSTTTGVGLPVHNVDEIAKQLVLYVCAFSNNQHNIGNELGQSIEDTPFYRVLQAETTTCVVMNLDQSATALMRAWCNFEFFLTHELRKPFAINTCEGPLLQLKTITEVAGVWITHMFQLLQLLDVNQAEASNEDDLKMISTRIAAYQGEGVAEGLVGACALNCLLKSLIADEALHILARKGDADSVALALKCRANPNRMDSRGLVPLTYAAAIHGSESQIVSVLLEHGAQGFGKQWAEDVVAMFDPHERISQQAINTIKAPRGQRTCPSGHALIWFKVDHGDFSCDRCLKRVPLGVSLASCRLCDFDICPPCRDLSQVVAQFHAEAIRVAECELRERRASKMSLDLASGTDEVCLAAIQALAVAGSDAQKYVPQLQNALAHKSWPVRVAACKALGESGAAASIAIEDLITALADRRADVRFAADAALEKLRSSGVEVHGNAIDHSPGVFATLL